METNIDHICRFCLQTTKFMEEIFTSKANYVKEIEALTGMKIIRDIKYPSLICTDCQGAIRILKEFKDKCIKSEEYFKQLVIEPKVEQEIDDHEEQVNKSGRERKKRISSRTLECDNEFNEPHAQQRRKSTRRQKSIDIKNENTNEFDLNLIKHEPEIVMEVKENPEDNNMELKDEPLRKKQKSEKNQTETINSKKDNPKSKKTIKSKAEHKPRESHKSVTTCHVCGKQLETSRLKYHLNFHTGDRPYPCTFENCGKKFAAPNLLQKHNKMVHSDNFPYKCDICGRQFKVLTKLKDHKTYHFDPQLPCKVCGKLLRNRKAVNKHMIVHTGKRPFSCDVCLKPFQNRYTLNVHQRVHTKEKPFICQSCGQMFAYNCLLKAHISKQHSIQTNGE